MNEILINELEDIKTSYELLIDGIEIFETKIKEKYIPYYSKKGDMKKVVEGANIIEEVKKHLEELEGLNNSWKKIVNEDLTYEKQEEQEDFIDFKEAVERTTWSIEDDHIRIETIRKNGKSSYPNIVPKHIFTDITKCIVEQFEKYNKTFFKKSGIAALMKDKIVADTNYKKSPGTVVYSTIKVLLKEEILARNKNSKSIYTLNKEPLEIREWLKENIGE